MDGRVSAKALSAFGRHDRLLDVVEELQEAVLLPAAPIRLQIAAHRVCVHAEYCNERENR